MRKSKSREQGEVSSHARDRHSCTGNKSALWYRNGASMFLKTAGGPWSGEPNSLLFSALYLFAKWQVQPCRLSLMGSADDAPRVSVDWFDVTDRSDATEPGPWPMRTTILMRRISNCHST